LKFVSWEEAVSYYLDMWIDVTYTSQVCPPNLWPLHSSLDIISYFRFAREASQCRRERSFDVVIRLSHIREGDATQLQVSGLVLAARIIEWKLRIELAAFSLASFKRGVCCHSSAEGQ
jgi:hypothetical protein